jgi:hypothetical protein
LDPHPEPARMQVAMCGTPAGNGVGPSRQAVFKREVLPANHPILHEAPQISSCLLHGPYDKEPRAAIRYRLVRCGVDEHGPRWPCRRSVCQHDLWYQEGKQGESGQGTSHPAHCCLLSTVAPVGGLNQSMGSSSCGASRLAEPAEAILVCRFARLSSIVGPPGAPVQERPTREPAK